MLPNYLRKLQTWGTQNLAIVWETLTSTANCHVREIQHSAFTFTPVQHKEVTLLL
jgi:hypothetical protein